MKMCDKQSVSHILSAESLMLIAFHAFPFHLTRVMRRLCDVVNGGKLARSVRFGEFMSLFVRQGEVSVCGNLIS